MKRVPWQLIVPAALIAAGALVTTQSHAQQRGRDLTVDEARQVVAAAGFTRGTIKRVGMLGRYELRSVIVEGGGRRGEYVVRLTVEPLGE